jgi:FkbM family methyltransferase
VYKRQIKYLVNKTSHKSNRIVKSSIGTFFCRRNTNDFQFANYYYEWGVKKFILSHIKEFTLFIDGGACIGDYSILVSKFNIRCIAFEPLAENFAIFQKNLQLNDLGKKVIAFNIGLGNVNKQARFKFNPVNTGASLIDRDNHSSSLPAEIRTIDSMLPYLKIASGEKILFKLDVEGMEPEALQGAVEFIRHYPDITFVMENKHTGQDPIKKILNETAEFEFGVVDEFNIFARKIRNFNKSEIAC